MQFVELYTSSIMMWITATIVGKKLFNENTKTNKIISAVIIICFSGLLSLINLQNFNFISGSFKIILVYVLQCIFYATIFHRQLSDNIIMALTWYIFLFLSEVIVAIIKSIVIYFIPSVAPILNDVIILTTMITTINLIIINFLKNKLTMIISNNNNIKKSTYVVILIILITMALLVFRIPSNEWKFDMEFILTMVILLGFCIIAFTLFKQKAQIQETTSKYLQLADYADITNNLLEDYRIVAHEHKNQLLVIRSMANPNNKELLNYIDDLLEKRENIKYPWIGQLNHLPISGLKGLINYKLMEMEQKKLNINITVSKEIMKSKLKKLSIKEKDGLYSIMGVYLDNMIQAAETSKEKEISIEIYKEKNDVVFLLANSYSGKIDMDKIDNYGYSTKGKNHGIGLHIVKKIMDEEPIFSQVRNITDDYYIQELRIHLNEINKNKEAA